MCITNFCEFAIIGVFCPDIDIFVIPTLHDTSHTFSNEQWSVRWYFFCWEKLYQSDWNLSLIYECYKLAKVF